LRIVIWPLGWRDESSTHLRRRIHEPRLHPGLIGHPRVVFTPHVGGGTVESRKEARLTCARNVAAALRGEDPPNAINQPGLRRIAGLPV